MNYKGLNVFKCFKQNYNFCFSFASFDPGTNCTTQISLKMKQALVSVVGSVLAGLHGYCRTMYMPCHIISIIKCDTCLVQRGRMKLSTLHTPCLEPNTPVMTFALYKDNLQSRNDDVSYFKLEIATTQHISN